MAGEAEPVNRNGVQSVHRALDLLEVIAQRGGQLTIGEVATEAGLPLPTTHRLLSTLVARGYMNQLPNRRYALGFRLLPLSAAAASTIGVDATGVLEQLVTALGETANLAVLSGARAQYVAQVPSRHSMRMFTEVGRLVDLHSTGVGKAMLAQQSDERALALFARASRVTQTEHTLATQKALLADLALIRERGYAVDEQEQEIGVRCVAVPVNPGPDSWLALSISGPVTRMSDELIEEAVPVLFAAARRLHNSSD